MLVWFTVLLPASPALVKQMLAKQIDRLQGTMSPEGEADGKGWRRWLGGLQEPLSPEPNPIRVSAGLRLTSVAAAYSTVMKQRRIESQALGTRGTAGHVSKFSKHHIPVIKLRVNPRALSVTGTYSSKVGSWYDRSSSALITKLDALVHWQRREV